MGFFAESLQQSQPTQNKALFPSLDEPIERFEGGDTQLTRTAQMAALAHQRNIETDEHFDTLMKIYEDRLAGGQEASVRERISSVSRNYQISTSRDIQQDLLTNPQEGLSVSSALEQEYMIRQSKNSQYALEREAIARIQELGVEDPTQASVMMELLKSGNALDLMRDNVAKMEIFNREMSKITEEAQDQGWWWDVTDVIATMIPTNEFSAALGLVPGAEYSWFSTPGYNLKRQQKALWDMTAEEFEEAMPGIVEQVKAQSGYLGENRTLQQQAMAHLYAVSDTDAMSFNLWTGLDVGSALPVGLLSRTFRSGARSMLALGNRSGGAKLAASDIYSIKEGLKKASGETAANVEDLIPSAGLVPTRSLTRPFVGMSSQIAKSVEDIGKMAEAVRRSFAGRFTSGEQAAAAAKLEMDAAARTWGSRIADFKMANPNEIKLRPSASSYDINGVKYSPEELVSLDERQLQVKLNAAREKIGGLTPEEVALLKSVDEGGIPAYMTNNLKKIARANGVTLNKNTLPEDVINAVRAKSAKSTPFDAFRVQQIQDDAAKMLDEILLPKEAVGAPTPLPRFGHTFDPDTEIASISFYLGKGDGAGYVSRFAAQRDARRMGFDLKDVSIHRNVDGQFFIKKTELVRETSDLIEPHLSGADFGSIDHISEKLRNPLNWIADVFGEAKVAQTHQIAGLQARLITPLAKNIGKVRDLKTLRTVMKSGEEQGKWFNILELSAEYEKTAHRLPTKAEVLGYYSAKELSDFVWHVFNRHAYINRARKGVKTVEMDIKSLGIKIDRTNGRIIDEPSFHNTRILDADTGKEGLQPKLKAKHDLGGYKVVELEQEIFLENGNPVKYIMVPNRSVKISRLERNQLNYHQGGSRQYTAKYTVKQARTGTFEDGATYAMDDLTLAMARTDKEALRMIDELEEARRAYIDEALDDAMKERIIAATPFKSLANMRSQVENGHFRVDVKPELVYDKGITTELQKRSAGVGTRWTNDHTPLDNYYIGKGQLYYSKKGDRLLDPNGEYAAVFDPLRTMQRSLGYALHTDAFGDYNIKVMEEWSRMASPHINKAGMPKDASLVDIFIRGELVDGMDPVFRAKLDAVRTHQKRFMNIKTQKQSVRELWTRNFAEYVATGEGGFRDKLSGGIMDSMSANPVQAFRGWVFDSYLGFFDPGQLLVQTQTAAAATSIHPIFGARASAFAPVLMRTLQNGNSNVIDSVAKNLRIVHGFEPEEFKKMLKHLDESNWMKVGGDQLMLDQFTNTIGSTAIARNFDNARKSGRYLFYLAERYNRAVAWQIAWKDTRKQFPDLMIDDPKFLGKVNLRTEDLSMNMTTASKAAWQSGAMSVPTQFMSYQARLLENMLPKVVGGSTRIRGWQKFRLAAGQLFLYGSAGLPFADSVFNFAKEMYEGATGNEMSPESYRKATKGMWDTLLYNNLGADTDFSSRVATGEAWGDMFAKLSRGELANFLQTLTGATGSVVTDSVEAASNIVKYFVAEQQTIPTAETWKLIGTELAGLISSTDRALGAYMVWKYGTLVNPETGQPIMDAETYHIFTELLGIPYREETETWEMIGTQAGMKEKAVDAGKEIARLRRLAWHEAEAGNWEAFDNYTNLVSGFMAAFNDDPYLQKQVLDQAHIQLNYNQYMWDTLVQRTQRNTGELPAGGR